MLLTAKLVAGAPIWYVEVVQRRRRRRIVAVAAIVVEERKQPDADRVRAEGSARVVAARIRRAPANDVVAVSALCVAEGGDRLMEF
jgi:hypothetical protein